MPGPMDSSAVITQISKEEARGPLRGKGTRAARRGLQPGHRGRREVGGRESPPGVRLGGARRSQPESERGESLDSGRLRDVGRGLAPLEHSRLLEVGKLRQG